MCENRCTRLGIAGTGSSFLLHPLFVRHRSGSTTLAAIAPLLMSACFVFSASLVPHPGRSTRKTRQRLSDEELAILMRGYIRTQEELYCDILMFKVHTCYTRACVTMSSLHTQSCGTFETARA